MMCDETEQQLTLYLYDELPADRRAAVAEHLAECKHCAKSLEQLGKLHQLLSERRAEEASPALLAWCRQALDDAIEREVARLHWRDLLANFFGRWGAIPATRGAWVSALLLLGFGLGWSLRPFTHRPSDTTRASAPLSPVGAADLGNFHISGISQVSPGLEKGEVNVTVDAERRVTLQGSLEDPKIRGVLLDAIKSYGNPGIRQDTLEVLSARASDPSVREALLYALRQDANVGVRLQAVRVVRDMEWTPQVRHAVLETLLKDSNPGVRVAAMDVLSKHLDGHILPALEQLAAKDPNPYIRLKSIAAVRRISPDGF